MSTQSNTQSQAQHRTTSHSMECYFVEMNRFRLLSREEEIELGKRIQKDGDPESLERMVNANLRLVVKIANQYSTFGLPVEDLVSEGNIGLMKAAQKFDPNYGVRFSTYAAWWIKQAIKQALGNQSRTIRLPLHVVQTLRDIDRAERKLSIELGRDPDRDELSQSEGITTEKVTFLRRAAQPVVSLDDQPSVDGVDSPGMASIFPDESAPDPIEEAIKNETEFNLGEMLSILTPREREVLISRYGLEHREPMTLEQVGSIFGVTRERIRQIQLAAIKKLGAAMKRLERPVRHPASNHQLRKFTPAPQLEAASA